MSFWLVLLIIVVVAIAVRVYLRIRLVGGLSAWLELRQMRRKNRTGGPRLGPHDKPLPPQNYFDGGAGGV